MYSRELYELKQAIRLKQPPEGDPKQILSTTLSNTFKIDTAHF